MLVAWPGQSEETGQWPPEVFRTVYSSRAFLDINIDEAHAAATLMAEAIVREEGFDSRVEVDIYDDVDLIEAALRRDEVDVVTLVAQDYLSLEDTGLLEPTFLTMRGEDVLEHSVLLVRADRDVEQLAQIQGGRLMVSRSARRDLPLQWLETTLIRDGLPHSGEMFVVENTRGPSQALTAVFFGKADVCIVLSSALDTAVELNPQLGVQLRVLDRSPDVLGSVICFSSRIDPRTRAQLLESLAELHLRPLGQQLLSVFRVDRLIPFEEQHLAGTRKLFGEIDLIP